MESGEQQIPGTWYLVLLLLLLLLVLASSWSTAQRRPAHHTRFHFAARISCACIASHSKLHFQICLPCCMPHAACCMLHAPACCSCCCSLSVAEQPWGSLGRLSRHRVIAHCTNLLCNKFPVLTASPFPLPSPPLIQPAPVPAPPVTVFRFRCDFLALNAQRMRRLSNRNWQLATCNVQHLWHSQVELRPLLRLRLLLLLLLVLSLSRCLSVSVSIISHAIHADHPNGLGAWHGGIYR